MCVPMKRVFLPFLPSLSDDAEEWRSQYHVSARFIWSEFFYFWTAESFLHLKKKKKKNVPLTFISSPSSPLPLLLWNVLGSQIIVWCWVPAALTQDISFSPCYQTEAVLPEPQDGLSTVFTRHSGQPRSHRSTWFWPPAFSRARFNQNLPVCGMDVAYTEALRNEADVGWG